jgi:hypothetical protein
MSRDYLPTSDDALNVYATNFAATLVANPTAYDLSAGDAAHVQGAAQDFTEALLKATDPPTRGTVTIEAKNAAKAVLVAILRTYCQMIKKNKGVVGTMKAAVGLSGGAGSPTPVPAPATQPLLTIIGATPLEHTLRFSDASTPDSKAKPPGADGLLLFCAVGATPPASPKAAQFKAIVSRQPFIVAHDAADAGKNAYYYGCWYTVKGLLGPFSQMVSMTIAA